MTRDIRTAALIGGTAAFIGVAASLDIKVFIGKHLQLKFMDKGAHRTLTGAPSNR